MMDRQFVVKCRLCGEKISCRPGLKAMETHWFTEHVNELFELKSKHEPSDINRDDW